MFAHAGGMSNMLKEGSKHFSGVEEAVLKNTQAGKELAHMVRSSLGPSGMNKMVINHLEKLFVTSDCCTIVREMEVAHPAAKILCLGANRQSEEVGDGTGLVISLGGDLLEKAEELIHVGLHPSDIVDGYVMAAAKANEILDTLVVEEFEALTAEDLCRSIRATFMAKAPGLEEFFVPKIVQACMQVIPEGGHLNVDSVRVAKVLGASFHDSMVVNGMVIPRNTEGTIKHMPDAKIICFNVEVEATNTENKGTVLIESSEQLMNYNKSEEKAMEDCIKAIADCGANVIITGSKFSEMALHFIERYKMMAIKIPSKFEMRRVCQTIGATTIAKLGACDPCELGSCSSIDVEELGDTQVCVFKQDASESAISTLLLRGATQNALNDLQRAIENGVNSVKEIIKTRQLCAGGGATEIELARQLTSFGESCTGMEQYAIKKFAESLEVIPRTLGENGGFNGSEVLASMYAAHEAGNANAGLDIDDGTVMDAVEKQVLDVLSTKRYAIKLAADSAITILRVDQIIMAKQAGGPKVAPTGR